MCLEGVDLALRHFFEEVAPIASGNDEVERQELGVSAPTVRQDVGVDRICGAEPLARETVLPLPRHETHRIQTGHRVASNQGGRGRDALSDGSLSPREWAAIIPSLR